MPTVYILVLPRRVNNRWPAGITKAEVSPSLLIHTTFKPLSSSLFTPHQILYSAPLMWSTYTHILQSLIFKLRERWWSVRRWDRDANATCAMSTCDIARRVHVHVTPTYQAISIISGRTSSAPVALPFSFCALLFPLLPVLSPPLPPLS